MKVDDEDDDDDDMMNEYLPLKARNNKKVQNNR